MFDKDHPVIFVTKDKLEVYKCDIGDQKTAKKIAEGSWNKDSLNNVIKNIINKLHYKKVRILLADDLSYNLEISINKDVENERLAVKEKIVGKISENLSDQDWDYKIITEKLDTKLVKFFAPLKAFWTIFSQAVKNAGLKIEAVEPVAIAKERHQNPIIGLCLKKDLQGKDEKVLNMKPIDDKSQMPSSFDYVDKTQPKSSISNKKLLTIVVTIFIISSLIIGGILRSRKSKQEEISSPSSLTVTTPSPAASSESSPSPETLDLSSYSIQVLNGSGVAGEADNVKDTLEAGGFEEINTSNADNYDYTDTEVSLKDDVSESIYDEIENILSSSYTVVLDSDPLTSSSDYDVVIIIGEKDKE